MSMKTTEDDDLSILDRVEDAVRKPMEKYSTNRRMHGWRNLGEPCKLLHHRGEATEKVPPKSR